VARPWAGFLDFGAEGAGELMRFGRFFSDPVSSVGPAVSPGPDVVFY
jgi:hypothetical protein